MAFYSSLANLFGLLPDKISADLLVQRFLDIVSNIEQNTEPMTRLDPQIGQETTLYKSLAQNLSRAGNPVGGYSQTVTGFINATFKKVLDDQDGYVRLIRTLFNKNNMKAALSMEQMQIIALICAIDKASSYARCFVYVLVRQEVGLALKPKERKYIDRANDIAQQQAFAATLKALNAGPDKVGAMLSPLKTAIYTPEAEKIIAGYNRENEKVDPLQANKWPGLADVAMFFGKIYTQYLKWRMDIANEENARLAVLIEALQAEKSGDVDEQRLARIEQLINNYTDQINRNERYVEELLEGNQAYDYKV